jgi:hypothetical protein
MVRATHHPPTLQNERGLLDPVSEQPHAKAAAPVKGAARVACPTTKAEPGSTHIGSPAESSSDLGDTCQAMLRRHLIEFHCEIESAEQFSSLGA